MELPRRWVEKRKQIMSKSLEALERLCEVKIYQKEASAYDYLGKEIYKEEFNIILKDLERLEELEEERANYDWEKDVINSLQQENQELKEENEKLETTIKILKDVLGE